MNHKLPISVEFLCVEYTPSSPAFVFSLIVFKMLSTYAKIVTFEHVTLSNMKCAIPIPNRPIGKFVLTILLGSTLFRDLQTGLLQIHTAVQFLIPSLYLQIVRFLWLYSTLIDFIISS